jgi:hypothetical protein
MIINERKDRKVMRSSELLAAVLLLAACGEDHQPMISAATPLNGSTAIDTSMQPQVKAGGNASVDPYDRKIVLFDVTGGAHKTVPGTVAVEGAAVTYEPSGALLDGHDYQLELTAGSISGELLDEVDGSEAPVETLSWPYRLGFRIGSCPRVRAAYLGDGPSILLRFSQPMNAAVTQDEIQVLDLGGKPMELGTPVWPDTRSVRVDLPADLEATGLYTILVSGKASGEDGILLDGDGDGKPGEPNDDFSIQFTGSQKVILSRLPASSTQ